LRRSEARDHVLALGIEQELAVKFLRPGRRIAGKGDARRRRFPHVAKNHGLNSDCGAKSRRNIVQPPVGNRARIHPGLEHGADGAPELFARILRERLAQGSFDRCREIDDQLPPILGRKLRIESYTFAFFIIPQDLFEYVMFDAQHHARIHLDETAVGIIGKTRIARAFHQRRDGDVVQSEV
jgi:hypothetical protein